MKILATMLMVTLFSLSAQATLPFTFEEEDRFSTLENEERLLKVAYSFADNNAASGDSISLSGTIPADTLVTQVAAYADAQIVSASDNTIAMTCETSGDLINATDFTDDADNSVTNGAVTALSGAVYSSDGCTLTLTIGSGSSGITAGRHIYLVKYIQPEEQ